MALADTHSIYAVSAGLPPGRATLSEENEEFAKLKGVTDATLTRISVNLFSQHLKPVRSVQSEARRYLVSKGLAWGFRGQIIVDNAISPEVSAFLQDLQMKGQALWMTFLKEYPMNVKKAESELGQIFHQSLFPTVEELESKYYFDIQRSTVDDPEDPRAGWSKKEQKQMKAVLLKQEKKNIKVATIELISRMEEPLQSLIESMGTYEGGPKGSKSNALINNVRELVAIMPGMNLTDDPELDSIREGLIKTVCQFDSKELKEDQNSRQDMLDAAADSLEKIGTFGKKIGAPKIIGLKHTKALPNKENDTNG